MAKFDFQLEGVLRHRLNIEKEKQRALALVQGKMTVMQNQLKGLDDSVKAANEDMRQNRLTGKLDLAFMGAHRRFLVATQQQAMHLIERMAEVNRDVDVARRALAAAAKDRKVIEKLKEKQQARWLAEINRKETADLDEIGMQLSYANLVNEGGEQ